ncbi:MAG: hypothetical protein ACFFE1_14335 [Candidatus Thorarchaeota archaeon]
MKKSREDPFLLPMCQQCGKYKGVGPCRNASCSEFEKESNLDFRATKTCSICDRHQQVVCSQCGQGFCKEHGVGAELNQLATFNQHVGTCVECKLVVCDDCWILNPNGDILCLLHLEESGKNHD